MPGRGGRPATDVAEVGRSSLQSPLSILFIPPPPPPYYNSKLLLPSPALSLTISLEIEKVGLFGFPEFKNISQLYSDKPTISLHEAWQRPVYTAFNSRKVDVSPHRPHRPHTDHSSLLDRPVLTARLATRSLGRSLLSSLPLSCGT